MKALVFGSLNIDFVYQVPRFVQAGETLASSDLARYCGGKGLNQAVALSRAGVETWMAGAVGAEGGLLLDTLRDAGVNTELVAACREPTGHAIIQNTPDGDNCILIFGGANRSISSEQVEKTLARFDSGDFLLVQNEINQLPLILRRAKEKGMNTVLNPSPMEVELIRELLPYTDILILNRGEGCELLGTDALEPENLATELWVRYPHITVVLTLGVQGAVLTKNGEILIQPAFSVPAVDTTGAGDTFTGYFLSAMMEDDDAAKALEFAAAAAALTVTRPGAAPSIPSRLETEQFMLQYSKEKQLDGNR